MRFAVPRMWRELSNHHDGCYFFTVNLAMRHSGKKAVTNYYPDTPSSIALLSPSSQLARASASIERTAED